MSNRPPDWHHRQTGFNLIEIMMTLTIVAIMVGIGLPSLNTSLDRRALASQADRLARSINYARSKAVNEQLSVGLEAKSGTWNWSNGWIIYSTTDNSPGTAYSSANDTLLKDLDPVGRSIVMVGNATRIKFAQTGRLVPGTPEITITVCDKGKSPNYDGSKVIINTVGRPSVSTIPAADKASDC